MWRINLVRRLDIDGGSLCVRATYTRIHRFRFPLYGRRLPLRPGNPRRCSVRVGSTNCCQGGQVYNVRRSIVHDRWHDVLLHFDFALLRLERDLTFSDSVQPIALPKFRATPPADQASAVVSGWGVSRDYSVLDTIHLYSCSV